MYEEQIQSTIEEAFISKRSNNNNLWFKNMVFKQGMLRKERGANQTAAFKAKLAFKSVAKARTPDYGIEFVKKLTANQTEAQSKRNKLLLEVARIDEDIHQRNVMAWKLFLADIKDGKTDAFIDE